MTGLEEALLFDGRSAGGVFVELEFTAQDLILREPGEAERRWPYSSLEIIDRTGALRLRSSQEPDCRLRLSHSLGDRLFRAAPHVFGSGARKGGQIALIAGLTAGAAAIAGLLFVGLPLAAKPLTLVTPPNAEATLGSNVFNQLSLIYPPCEGPRAEAALEAARPLLSRLYDDEAEPFDLTFRFVDVAAPNAMALPGGYVMATRGLIETLDHPDQFAAVIAHELAHVRNRDALTGLYRSVGLGLLLDLITGGSGLGQQIILLAGQVTDLQYTRGQEVRADEDALKLLEEAGINPTALADAFETIQEWDSAASGGQPLTVDLPEWLSSHPDTSQRIARARTVGDRGFPPSLSSAEWDTIQGACAK